MTRISVDIDFSQVRERIAQEMAPFKPIEWARKLGVSKNIVANIHGKTQQKPSFEYITAVSVATGKSMDYLLWGRESNSTEVAVTVNDSDQAPENEMFDSLGIVEGMSLLTKIYASADNVYIRAINANLMAFSDAVENKARANDMEKRMQEMEANLAEMRRYVLELKKQEEAREKARLEEQSSKRKVA